MMSGNYCEICKKSAEMSPTDSMVFVCNCQRCGLFTIAWEAIESVRATPSTIRPYLSAATRQATENGQRLGITTKNLRELSELHQRTTVSEKLDKILGFLAKKTMVPGGLHIIRYAYDYPLADARDEKEFKEYVDHLVRRDLLRAEATGRGPGELAYAVTIGGGDSWSPCLGLAASRAGAS